jgi:anthranilate phosphoribosyltransferase
MIKEAGVILAQRQNLSSAQMRLCMEEIMLGQAQTPDIVFFLERLAQKGETLDELTAAVEVMRKYAVKIDTEAPVVLDTCGTGGDKKGTFNISTCVAFVASGCGITVAKHGNRSVSSRSGSADILEALGINILMDKEDTERCLEEVGVAFLFAPNLHPAMKYAMPARKQIGRRTIFNILGPLSNPAGAKHQLIGVFDRALTGILAQVLLGLGSRHVLAVHGEDGLDEVTLSAKTYISEARADKVHNYEIQPEDFGIKRAGLEDLSGSGAQDNAKILIEVLKGRPGPKKDIVLLNSACAIYAADKAGSLKDGLKLASASIESGAALKKLELLKSFSQKQNG